MFYFFGISWSHICSEQVISQAYFKCRAETRRVKKISVRLSLAWHASVLDGENLVVLKKLY